MKYTISISCCFCLNGHKAEVELPEGWAHRFGGIDDEDNGFCPDHALVADFAAAQCPGCVGGWGDCGLWGAFAYAARRSLTEADFAILRSGRCPKRVNGTFGVTAGGSAHTINLSDLASPEAGEALAQAISDYWIKHPVESRVVR